MTSEVFSLLLDKRVAELSDKAVESGLSKTERAELRALTEHQDKAPAVAHRIRILAARLAQPSRWGLLMLRFSKKFKQNFAELEALVHYGNSRAVWEIAYLHRKKAVQKLTDTERCELEYLTLYHDSSEVLRMAALKTKARLGELNAKESRELAELQRNPYRKSGIPNQLLEMFWPSHQPQSLDVS